MPIKPVRKRNKKQFENINKNLVEWKFEENPVWKYIQKPVWKYIKKPVWKYIKKPVWK